MTHFPTHSEAQTRTGGLTAPGSYQHEVTPDAALTGALDPSEILRVAQAGFPPKALGALSSNGEVFGHRFPRRGKTVAAGLAYLEETPTASRFRPLARRRLITARPLLVFIRARKPWVRRRRMRLG